MSTLNNGLGTNQWRFDLTEHGTLFRGRPYQIGDDGDQWRWYWEGDSMVGINNGYYRDGWYATTENDDTDRALEAVKAGEQYDVPLEHTLKVLAQRITGNWDADFICVGLDRGHDFYALSWNGDPEREWANEIEAVAYGDVWRCEVEEYNTFTEQWEPSDDLCEEWYGIDKAEAGWEKEFPLDAVPAEFHIEEAVGA